MKINTFNFLKLSNSLSFNQSSQYPKYGLIHCYKKSTTTHFGVNLIKSFSTLSISNNSCMVIPMNYCLSSYRKFSSMPNNILRKSSFKTIFPLRGKDKPIGHAAKVLEATRKPSLTAKESGNLSTTSNNNSLSHLNKREQELEASRILPSNFNQSDITSSLSKELKPHTPSDNYKGPLQPMESVKDQIAIPIVSPISTDLKDMVIKDLSTEINSLPTYKNELSPEAQRFNSYEDAGIIKYDNKGSVSLTREASLLYSASLPKPEVKTSTIQQENNKQEEIGLKITDVEFINNANKEFVAGTLIVKPETEILSPIQSHIVVGERKDENIELFGTFTSDKGQQAGLAGFQTTTKLSNTQINGNTNKAQYVRPISPPVQVTEEQFIEHDVATKYANEPNVQDKLETIQRQAERFKPVPYKGTGYTVDDLDAILDLKNSMTTSNSNVEIDTTNISDD